MRPLVEQLDQYKILEKTNSNDKIILAKFVGSFAEAMIEEPQKMAYHDILVEHYHRKVLGWYL